VLNKLGPQTSHTISVPCEQPLAAGQKVELGIAESSLLGSALLVYMAPLVGLFVMASIFQVLFASDIASLCGALLGGVGGFLVARGLSPQLAARQSWQPVILSVALPPDLLRVDTPSSDMGSDFTGPYLYLPFLLQRHNFCGYAGSNSISWFRGCSVECGVFGLKNVRHSTAAS
jgi:sigma-E factor negative regulatory protein RseC